MAKNCCTNSGCFIGKGGFIAHTDICAENKRAHLGRPGAFLERPILHVAEINITKKADAADIGLLLDFDRREQGREKRRRELEASARK